MLIIRHSDEGNNAFATNFLKLLPSKLAFGILHGMTVKIDPAGRVILPKRVRERLGLRAGAEIELTEAGGELRLRPFQQRPSLVREGPWLVHTGRPAPGFDSAGAVDQDREERMAHVFAQP